MSVSPDSIAEIALQAIDTILPDAVERAVNKAVTEALARVPVAKDGRDGRDGVSTPGTPGRDGNPGPAGRGIATLVIEDGLLKAHFTDGSMQEVGRVVGPAGEAGKSIDQDVAFEDLKDVLQERLGEVTEMISRSNERAVKDEMAKVSGVFAKQVVDTLAAHTEALDAQYKAQVSRLEGMLDQFVKAGAADVNKATVELLKSLAS